MRSNKWLKSSRLPVINDVVLFVFNESNFAKESISWKLGKVVNVQGTKVSLRYSMKAKGVEQFSVRIVRDISNVYSLGEMLINTVDHFNECSKLSQAPEE